MNAYDVIIKPIRSEKSYEGIADKKYVFVVDRRANKTQIKAAVEEIFKVKGYTSQYKKAYVQLTASSKSIEFFDSLT